MQVVKNFLYNLSYQLLVIVLPLITVPYVSSILGAGGIGDYAFTNANMQYFLIFGMVGITLYGNRQVAYVRDNKEKLRSTFYSIYTVQLITTTISLLLYLIFVLVFNNGRYMLLYFAQGINIIASMVDISWLFMGLEEFKKTVVRNTIVKIVSLASIFIFVKSINDTIIYTLIISISTLIGNLTLWLYIPKSIGIKKIKILSLKSHLKSSMALFIPQIAIQIYILLDRTLLGIITDNIQVGYYDNSQKIVKLLLTISTAISTVMMPKISNIVATGNMEKVKYYIKNSLFFVSLISIPLMFGLMGIANELCPWFFTDKFEGIENLIIVSSIIIVAISLSSVLGMQFLVPLNKIKQFTISVTSGAIVNFILNLIIIRYWGAMGACISTIISEFIVTTVQFYFVKDFIKLKELIYEVGIFIISACIMFMVVRVIGVAMGIGILTNLIQVIMGGISYLIMVEVFYRLLKKQSIVKYVKGMIN